MRVFVSGATGFIGTPLVTRLLDRGHDVTAWVRDPASARARLDARARLAPVEAPEPVGDPLDRVIVGHDAVVSLAGAPVIRRWTPAYRREIVDSRVGLTRRIAASIRRAGGVRVLLSASGVGVYGDRGDEILTESSAPGDDFLATLCVDWEAAAREAPARVVLARIGFVLGAGGGALAAMRTPFRLGLGGVLGDGRHYMPWIHLDDLLALFVTALEDEAYDGPVNAVGPSPVTNRVFTRALGRAMRRPTIAPVPTFALRALYGEAAAVILASTRAVPAAAEAAGFEHRHPDLDAALRDVLAGG